MIRGYNCKFAHSQDELRPSYISKSKGQNRPQDRPKKESQAQGPDQQSTTKEFLNKTLSLECSWHIVVPTIVAQCIGGFNSLRNGVKCNCVIPVRGDCMYATMVTHGYTMVHDNSL